MLEFQRRKLRGDRQFCCHSRCLTGLYLAAFATLQTPSSPFASPVRNQGVAPG